LRELLSACELPMLPADIAGASEVERQGQVSTEEIIAEVF
jgi:hypothetical protein